MKETVFQLDQLKSLLESFHGLTDEHLMNVFEEIKNYTGSVLRERAEKKESESKAIQVFIKEKMQ